MSPFASIGAYSLPVKPRAFFASTSSFFMAASNCSFETVVGSTPSCSMIRPSVSPRAFRSVNLPFSFGSSRSSTLVRSLPVFSGS